jgi:16S rRNA (cytosine1407-C5)-methyltransferase
VKKEKPATGGPAFHEYYRGIYGSRWDGLAQALGGPSRPCGLRVRPEGGYDLLPPDQAPVGLACGCGEEAAAQASEAGAGDPAIFYLDEASVAAAASLVLPAEGQVLDACAAPGGKSLVLAARMGPELRLLCNELSQDRRRRLVAVLDESLPPGIRSRVSVLGADAASLCLRRPEAFGAVLLDAPCSSERHVLADPAALAAWTPSRPRALARRQYALLSSAFLMLAPGGSLVYSTCSINPGENDGVAQRLMERHGDRLSLDRAGIGGAEPTEFGCIVMPDSSEGAGPMYVFRARKA